jgi:hypothetical protein
VHDARIGRFLSVDPLAPDYPHNSPYAFSENVVINAVELEGLEKSYVNKGTFSEPEWEEAPKQFWGPLHEEYLNKNGYYTEWQKKTWVKYQSSPSFGDLVSQIPSEPAILNFSRNAVGIAIDKFSKSYSIGDNGIVYIQKGKPGGFGGNQHVKVDDLKGLSRNLARANFALDMIFILKDGIDMEFAASEFGKGSAEYDNARGVFVINSGKTVIGLAIPPAALFFAIEPFATSRPEFKSSIISEFNRWYDAAPGFRETVHNSGEYRQWQNIFEEYGINYVFPHMRQKGAVSVGPKTY